MKHLKTEVTIHAPVAEVWKNLLDFESYPKWNPFIKKVKGSGLKDEQIGIWLKIDSNKTMNIKPVVLQRRENSEFRWLGHLFIPGIFDGEHYFILEPVERGTRLTHGENFKGILSGLVLKMVGESTVRGFRAMNEALKKRVEG